jgi:transcription factor STE12
MAPQKPETFMLSTEAQQALPHDAQVALQQVDNCEYPAGENCLISAY